MCRDNARRDTGRDTACGVSTPIYTEHAVKMDLGVHILYDYNFDLK